ncbi:MAG: hypothetical protein NT096_01600 [Proteobacteria bacterium]|nr:hypothetical protein [Pseudomonadota bacterium]
MNSLRKEFEFVQKTFFPYLKGWRIRNIKNYQWKAGCLIEKKMIVIRDVSEDQIERYELMIHELAHSSRLGHAKKWTKCMLKVAEKAQNIGMNEIAKAIKKDVELCQKGERQREGPLEQVISDLVGDWAWETAGEKINFMKIIRSAAFECGLTLKELREKKRLYLKLKKIFKDTRFLYSHSLQGRTEMGKKGGE